MHKEGTSKDADQIKRFKKAAKEHECDESEGALDKAFKSIKPRTEPTPKKKREIKD